MNLHRWLIKGKWQRYAIGNYIYREDICGCGCIRRVAIDDEGNEVVESYTKDDVTSASHTPCTRPRKVKKSRRRNSTYQKLKTMLNQAPTDERSVATDPQ